MSREAGRGVLEELHIRGLGVIDDAVLPLDPGLTVVTGETGAGKTMVVTGLLLLFGGRGDASRVRSGAEQASIDGRIDLGADLASRPAAAAAAERVRDAGGELDDGRTLLLRRVVSASGRSRAHVGGAPAPVSVLGELAERLVAVHGQSDQLLLTRPAEQRAVLDRYAGLALDDYRAAYEQWRRADAQLRERTEHAAELRRESDLLAYGLAEIEAADPQPGEDAELTALAARLAHADALRLAARAAHDALAGDADTPMADTADVAGLIGAAGRSLAAVSGADPQLDALAERLADLSAVATELAADLGGYGEQLDADPARLDEVEARRAVLAGLARKYTDGPPAGDPGGDMSAVLDWAKRAAARLAEIDVSDDAIAALVAERDAAAGRVAALAAELTAARTSAADRLAAAVTAELAGLAMGTARLLVELRPRTAGGGAPLHVDGAELNVGPDGADEVEFRLQPHPDTAPLPLGRGASGGELSRVMLALEVCTVGGAADSAAVPTMVFDEVDAGVGGRAAVEVGRRLARLAQDRQVIVVTHLAQVAAYADSHVVVAKPADPAGSVLASDVRPVTGEERIAELARMLGGSDSGAAREHAAELLTSAQSERAAGLDRRERAANKANKANKATHKGKPVNQRS
jgi:DNA repair protein RecN (Recombination protein N)